jgi:hypothetical protein
MMIHLGLDWSYDFMALGVCGGVWRCNENLDATRKLIHRCIITLALWVAFTEISVSTPGIELDVSYIIDNCSGHLGGLLALNHSLSMIIVFL